MDYIDEVEFAPNEEIINIFSKDKNFVFPELKK